MICNSEVKVHRSIEDVWFLWTLHMSAPVLCYCAATNNGIDIYKNAYVNSVLVILLDRCRIELVV